VEPGKFRLLLPTTCIRALAVALDRVVAAVAVVAAAQAQGCSRLHTAREQMHSTRCLWGSSPQEILPGKDPGSTAVGGTHSVVVAEWQGLVPGALPVARAAAGRVVHRSYRQSRCKYSYGCAVELVWPP
jgi:hypothetical protein